MAHQLRERSEHKTTRSAAIMFLRRMVPWALACGALATLAMPTWAQGKQKPGEQALALLVLPLGIFVSATLQIAALAAFPRFSKRCAVSVERYRWQTPLIGLAGWLGVLLLVAVFSAANEQAAAIPILTGVVFASIGGVGVSLVAGRWAMQRIGSETPAHPVLQVIAGAFALGWAMVLIPCAGQLLWLAVACASMGAIIHTLIRGSRLDETVRRRPAPSAQPPAPTPMPEPTAVTEALAAPPSPEPEPEEQAPAGTSDSQGSQVF